MKRKIFARKCFTAFFSCVFFVSCYNGVELSDISDNILLPEELTLPIGKTQFTVPDILDRLNLEDISIEMTGNEINIVLSDSETFTYRALNLADEVPELNISSHINSLPPGTVIGGGNMDEIPLRFVLDINNDMVKERIDSAHISLFEVEMTVTATNIDLSKIEIDTEFESSNVYMLDGSTTKRTITPVNGAASQLTYNNLVIIPAGTDRKGIPMDVTIRVKQGETITIQSGTTLGISYKIKALDYSVIYGKIPPAVLDTHNNTHNFDISDFDGFYFANPQITIDVESNVGIYFLFNIDYIRAYKDTDPVNTTVYADFDGQQSTTWRMVNRSMEPFTWFEEHIGTYDKDNNTDALFSEHTPNVLEYGYSVSAAESLEPEDKPFFITKDAELTVYARADVPLYFKENSHMSYNDTISGLDLGETFPEKIELDTCILELKVLNGLPVRAILKMKELLDENGNPLRDRSGNIITLSKDEYIIKAPAVHTTGTPDKIGTVIDPLLTVVEIPLNLDDYHNLLKTNKIVYEVLVDRDSSDERIHFTPNDMFSIELGLYLKAKITTDDINDIDNN